MLYNKNYKKFNSRKFKNNIKNKYQIYNLHIKKTLNKSYHKQITFALPVLPALLPARPEAPAADNNPDPAAPALAVERPFAALRQELHPVSAKCLSQS